MLGINMGGTAEVNSGFCPRRDGGLFCCIKPVKWLSNEQAKLEKVIDHFKHHEQATYTDFVKVWME